MRGADLMRAVLAPGPFDEPGWVFERKLDGIRCLAVKRADVVTLLSRNDLPLTGRFPSIAQALGDQPGDFALDGEVVGMVGERTSFGALARGAGAQLRLYVFDALSLQGEDLRALPLTERRSRLRAALAWRDPVRYSEHLEGDGVSLFERACAEGWEGLIAKRADSPYVARRSRDWLKVKCGREQELVIGGFTEPKGSRTGFGALLVGYHAEGRLRYAGKVGTGFDRRLLTELTVRLQALRRDRSPFADAPRSRGVTWVEPVLVAQIGFSEWTGDGRLRHPRFIGLREDKAARDVVREVPGGGA